MQPYLNVLCILLPVIAVATLYAVIGILTGFRAKKASGTQRNFTLTWLICGQVQRYVVGNVEKLAGKKSALKGLFYAFLLYGSYCLCGFIVVAQEMIEFGTCKAG